MSVILSVTILSSFAPVSRAGALSRHLRHGIAGDSRLGPETGLVALVGRGLRPGGDPGPDNPIDVAAIGIDIRNIRILARVPSRNRSRVQAQPATAVRRHGTCSHALSTERTKN